MKFSLFILALSATTLIHAQAYTGNGDNKLQVGANIQDNATGLNVSFDYGIGENISLGIVGTYALGIDDSIEADFGDRMDVRGRFNAHLGNVLNIDENFDLYPGLSFSLKNFGGHVGARYFFTPGFGIFTEALFPLAKYNSDALTPAEKIHNQFALNIGASFNL